MLNYWTKNNFIIDDPKINPTFYEILSMNGVQLTEWIDFMRSEVLRIWDEVDIPPLSGASEEEMIQDFREMQGFPVSKFQRTDELDGLDNVILNTTLGLGSCVNQWFPTMMKSKINYNTSIKNGDKFNGYSVYDLFKDPRFRRRMQLGCRRHFRRDSFYRYSISIEKETAMGIVPCKTGLDWMKIFHSNPNIFEGYDFWLSEVDVTNVKGSGYTEVNLNKFLWLSKDEVISSWKEGYLNDACRIANLPKKLDNNKQYHIRFFKKVDRLFPLGFTAFKIGYIQVAVNFPPLTAKYLYEKYTDHIKKQNHIILYDPSSGWGGRIIGAMSVRDRNIHYVGTDPNTDNVVDKSSSRYELVANFFNNAVLSNSLRSFWGETGHTFEVFQECAEDIHNNRDFKKYKGKLDLVFTSPPYFNREGYSEDKSQSLSKYPQYDSWRDNFLYPTLKTCVEYLKKDRYLLWNIADIKVGSLYYPLEEDSKKILLDLGMEFIGIEKMCLMSMPGSNRIGDDGKPTAKNFCKVEGKWRKYEPIFVFRKPK